MSELHPDVIQLRSFLGRWRGRGKGSYPTIDPFEYEEEAEYWHVGKAFVAYSQKTWRPDTGEPLHQEMGYLRPMPGGSIEMVISHPTGIAEILEGRISDGRIEAETTLVGLTSTAKDVRRLRRSIQVRGDEMSYVISMAAVGVPMTEHLRCELRRV
jgi:hypothetical protein